MRKLANIATLTAVGFILLAFSNNIGDLKFEGVITYTMSADGNVPPEEAAMMQGGMKTYIKNNLFRSEGNFGMFKQISISDKRKPGETIMLMEVMGNKYQIKMDDKVKKQIKETKPEIKYLDSTKTIAGYICMKAQSIITDKMGNKTVTDIYYTNQLPYDHEGMDAQFRGLKGFPLSYSTNESGMKITLTAQSVQKQSVPDSLFVVPAGYKLMTEDEIEKDMTQKMSGGGSSNSESDDGK